MKTRTTTHSYDNVPKSKDTSENYHMEMLRHFSTKTDFSPVFKKTDKERSELKTRMYAYPNKRHKPVPPNN